MSEIRPLADGNVGSKLDIDSSNFGDELAENSAFIKALEVVVLRNIPRLLIPIFEPLVRRVVKEEIELAQQRFSTSTNQNSGEMVISPQLRKLKLRFRNELSLLILTGKPILGKDGSPVKIDLIDENTGQVVKFGPEASARVEVVVLRVDSDDNEGQEWTSEKFTQNIVTGSGKNKSLLTGKTFLNLIEGIGSLDKISFAHGSSWTKKCEFMLGARFANNYDGITVAEAKSERFTLEDCRSKLYGKHHPPILTDEVWRLENIRKGGKFHTRLNVENIKTVKDFLIQYFVNCQRLQEIVQMPDKVFAATVEHGLTCKRDKHIYHPPNSVRNAGVVFDAVGKLLGVLLDNGFVSVDKLSEKAKDDAQISIASAFENWGDVIRYDENYIPSISTQEMPSPRSDTTHSVIASHTRPSTSSSERTIFRKNPQLSVVYDHMQPSTSSLSSECILGKSHLDFAYDAIRPTVSPSVGTTSPNNPVINITATTGDLDSLCDLDIELLPDDIEFLREILRSPRPDPEPESRGLDDHDKEQRTRIRRWPKMVLVVKFLFRMRMEKAEHVRKRMRIG